MRKRWSTVGLAVTCVLAGCGPSGEAPGSSKWDNVKTVPVVAPFDRFEIPLAGGQVFDCTPEENPGSRHPVPAVCSIAHRRTSQDDALDRYHAHLTKRGFRRTEVAGNMYLYRGPKFELSLDAVQSEDVAAVHIVIGTPNL